MRELFVDGPVKRLFDLRIISDLVYPSLYSYFFVYTVLFLKEFRNKKYLQIVLTKIAHDLHQNLYSLSE